MMKLAVNISRAVLTVCASDGKRNRGRAEARPSEDGGLQARANRVELPGRAELFVLVRDEICVLLDENFSRAPEIELLGMIAEEFPMHTRPDQASIRVDIYLRHTELR